MNRSNIALSQRHCDFLEVLGGEFPDSEKVINLDLREAIHSTQNIVAGLCILVSLFYLTKACVRSSFKCIEDAANESVFYYLDFIGEIDKEADSDEQFLELTCKNGGDPTTTEREVKLRSKTRVLFLMYICDNSCKCCRLIWNAFKTKAVEVLSKTLRKNAKKLSFIILLYGYFFYYQVILLAPILLLSECVWKSNESLLCFKIIDFVLGSFYFSALVFIFSFINTKKELLGLGPEKKYERGMIVYYHCKKSLIFGVFHAIMKITFILLFNDPLFENSTSLYNGLYWTLRNIFFLALVQYNDVFSQVPISRDDIVLKAQSRYYAYQNIVLKYFPREELLYNNIRKTVKKSTPGSLDDKQVFCKKLESSILTNLRSLRDPWERELHIVESQKYKRIVKNTGLRPLLQIMLYVYLFVDCVMQILLGLYTVLATESLLLYFMAQITLMCLNIFEITFMPILIFMTLKRKNLLGNDEEFIESLEEIAYDKFLKHLDEIASKNVQRNNEVLSLNSKDCLSISDSSSLSEIFKDHSAL